MKTHFCLRRGGLCIEVTCRYRVGWSGLPYQVSQLYDSICELTNLTIGILLDYTDNQVPALVVGLGLLFRHLGLCNSGALEFLFQGKE